MLGNVGEGAPARMCIWAVSQQTVRNGALLAVPAIAIVYCSIYIKQFDSNCLSNGPSN